MDSLNHRVQRFTKEGKFLGHWGRHGSADGELDLPWGISLDGHGDVYVAVWNKNRVQKFSPEGELLVQFHEFHYGVGELKRPSGVAVDSGGDV